MKKLKHTTTLTLLCFIVAFQVEAQNLVYVETEHVSPGHRTDYYNWAREYKELADETNGPDFYVASNSHGFSYIFNIGNNMASMDDHRKKMREWWQANPKTSELSEKYGHTVSKITRYLWRHDDELSYDVESAGEDKYIRITVVNLKQGKGADARALLKEYKEAWTNANIDVDYHVYWNVFGLQGATFQVVQGFKDLSHYAAYESSLTEKIGKEKLDEWMTKWGELMMSYENNESWGHMELSHFNE